MEGGAEKKDERENQLKRTKSRELRGGIMYYSCHCIKRNGLQHDCRRTGCGGEPACLVLPDPLCAPSQLARARGLADPSALAAHMQPQGGSGAGGTAGGSAGGSVSGKKFIVCELKGIIPEVAADKSGKCCKCPAVQKIPQQSTGVSGGHSCICTTGFSIPKKHPVPSPASPGTSKCDCKHSALPSNSKSLFVFTEDTINSIIKSFEEKKAPNPGGHSHKAAKPVVKEPCTRPGCLHWQPPPPCVWDAPCKADCFEAHPGIQPGRNPLTGAGGTIVTGGKAGSLSRDTQQPRDRIKLLTPECCTGCCVPPPGAGAGTVATSGGLPAGVPVLVMKLC